MSGGGRIAGACVVAALAVACGDLIAVPASDSAPDASAADATVPTASAEAGADFCAGATFCDRFERTSDAGAGWSGEGEMNGGALSLTAAHAGTTALRATLPGANDATASLKKQGLPAGATVRVTFSMWIDRLPGRTVNIGLFDYADSSDAWGAYLVLDDAGLHVDETRLGTSYFKELAAISPPLGRWFQVVMELTRETPGRLRATVDGKVQVDGVTLHESYDPSHFDGVVIGSEYTSQGADATILDFDDVRIDVF